MNSNHDRSMPAGQEEAVGTATFDAPGNPQPTLDGLRSELDHIDRALLETLHLRLATCRRIGRHKRSHAIPMMQPERIGIVQARAAAYAEEHGISPPFIHALYELIIAETCRLEDEIIGGA